MKIGRNTEGGGSFDNIKEADELGVTRPDEGQMEREAQKERAMVDGVRRLLYLIHSWGRKPNNRISRWAIRPVRV